MEPDGGDDIRPLNSRSDIRQQRNSNRNANVKLQQ